jgi:hypothetical protein
VTVIANLKLQVSMAVFTTAFSLGCVVITRLFMLRVLQAEVLQPVVIWTLGTAP